ncbi:Tat pathway signal sequence domain protein [Occultella kanbiaonis]|uniref:exo-rhamnogalacturonan lyase family protein n=1 Tax=Occultella kanbiaonis TaxID=2675754 RepID=UPI001E5071E0|nr:Tat pathway signal sequence domain protein [Occultella kanbiaonis]
MPADSTAAPSATIQHATVSPPPDTALHWLEDTPAATTGVTWGVPWARGALAAGTPIALRTAGGSPEPVQTWVTATWPDGSVKWTAHAAAPAAPTDAYALEAGTEPSRPARAVSVTETGEDVLVDTGAIRIRVPRTGEHLIAEIETDGRVVASAGRLVSLLAAGPDDDGPQPRTPFSSRVRMVTVEQSGPLRAVLRIDGVHGSDGTDGTDGGAREWLPFTVRLYAYAGSPTVRLMHSFVWDGDADRDFLAGLGVRFDVPLREQPHDRHVRLAGSAGGFLTEAVRGITGLRRDPGSEVRAAQVAGRPTPPTADWAPAVAQRLHWVPTWNDWSLHQGSPDGYTVRKRTADGVGWVGIGGGTRAGGYAYLGDTSGGLELGLRDFWKGAPTQIDVRGATTDVGELTVWLWSPESRAMDLRFFHDGLGQDGYADQLDALEITYEDYEPGFGDANGIARTHELSLTAVAGTPSSAVLATRAAALATPPLLVTDPDRLHAAGVFGDWDPVDRSTPARAAIEDRNDFLLAFYLDQVEQRRWYGFWDYGDVMHTYDADRHTWRYDVGGYAWDNSELSPDLWFWLSFLRSGRADLFRLAEAMTRHTGEVDVYHAGAFAGLGTRHNVQHWGCSAKQLRISNPAYRRFYYYLTADERVGDLLDELAGSERALLGVDATRKVRSDVYSPDPAALSVGLGTDWGALAATWLTRWERHGDTTARDKLLGTMADIGALANGFLTGEARLDLSTGRFDTSRERLALSHLSAVFGLVEVCSELIDLADVPGFERAWLQYCRLYLADAATQEAELGQRLTGISLIQAHSRLTAYAAHRTDDAELAAFAWRRFFVDSGDMVNRNALQRVPDWSRSRIDGPEVAEPVDEAPFVSTNDASQFGLAAIQNLALIGNHLEGTNPA